MPENYIKVCPSCGSTDWKYKLPISQNLENQIICNSCDFAGLPIEAKEDPKRGFKMNSKPGKSVGFWALVKRFLKR